MAKEVKEWVERKEDKKKKYYDQNCETLYFKTGQKLLVLMHPSSNVYKIKVLSLRQNLTERISSSLNDPQ